jgi:hypothetical protein
MVWPITLLAGAKCTISVFFDPTLQGILAGSLSIQDDGINGQHTVSLTGTASSRFLWVIRESSLVSSAMFRRLLPRGRHYHQAMYEGNQPMNGRLGA